MVRDWPDEHFPDRWIGRRGPYDWPARSLDLSPCDFFLWEYLNDTVFKQPLTTIQELKQRIEEACEQIPEEMCRKVCRSVQQRLHVCMNNGGRFVSN